MYLISIYFDDSTTKRFEDYIRQVAKHTGNDTMIEGAIPPHITVSAFYAQEDKKAAEIFEKIASQVSGGELTWVAPGSFLPNVLFLTPVLNSYLHQLSTISYQEVQSAGALPHEKYIPFQWLPHTTIGKMLNREQLQAAFAVLQNQFSILKGNAVGIGLAKTNPYTDMVKIVFK